MAQNRENEGIDLRQSNEKNQTTGQFIADAIRNGILKGTYSLGEKLKEIDLCREFGVSRTPVREAFRLLQNEGILEYIPQRGVRICPFNETDVIDSMKVRAALEVFSARTAARYATENDIARLRGLNEQIRDFHPEDSDRTGKLDMEFHSVIARISQNRFLEEMLARLMKQCSASWLVIPMRAERTPHTYKEHDDVITALERRDPELAERYMDIHFLNSIRSVETKTREYVETHPSKG